MLKIKQTILNYIFEKEITKKFYNKHLDKSTSTYRVYKESKKQFLEIFEMRSKINTDVNKFEIYGSLELINALKNSKVRYMMCHNIECENNLISIYTNRNSTILFGFILKENEELVGKSI